MPVLHIDPHEQRERHQGNDKTAAPVTNQRQREALGRQDAHIHPQIDQHLRTQPHCDAEREVGLEVAIAIGRIHRDGQRPPYQRPEHADQQHGASHTKFLSYNCKYKIGMRLGQIEKFLHAIAETDPEPFAAAYRD